MEDGILNARGLKKYFTLRDERGGTRLLKALDSVSLSVRAGEIVGVVGESGCGKSTMGKTLMRIYEPDGGTLHWRGRDMLNMSTAEMRAVKKDMQMIFQDPFSSLNPRRKVKDIIAQPLAIQSGQSGWSRKKQTEITERVEEVMNEVGINPAYSSRYPHQFSGGQRQRIGIARALASKPDFVVCDEAVSALDVSIQAQVLNLLLDLRERYGFASLFISHDLSVVEFISERVLVMYLGRVVEEANRNELMKKPLHPYTKALFESSPVAAPSLRSSRRQVVVGDVPSPVNPPQGCHFHPRCPIAGPECRVAYPPYVTVSPGRKVACWKVSRETGQ